MFEEFTFRGIADAAIPAGFGAICSKALLFISEHYSCDYSFDEGEFRIAYHSWIKLAEPLPLEAYNFDKRNLIAVAVLIQAVGSCKIADFMPRSGNLPPLLQEYPCELLALVMGLILNDIALRTGKSQPVQIQYVPIENLDGFALKEALETMREKGTSNHQRRFAKLLKILQLFNVPPTFH